MNQPGGVKLFYLSLAQTARLGALIRDLGLERWHPGAINYARDMLESQYLTIDDANAANADLIALGLAPPCSTLRTAGLRNIRASRGRSARSTPRPSSRSLGCTSRPAGPTARPRRPAGFWIRSG